MRRHVFRLAILSLALLGTSGVQGDDQQIAQQIIEKLQAEKKAGTLKGFSIDLQVDEGTVWLSGRVASEQQQARALDLARRVPGVQQVVNDLAIGAPPAKAAVPAFVPPLPATHTAQQAQAQSAPAAATPAQPQDLAALVAGPQAPAKPVAAEQKPASPAQNTVLNNVSKTLMTAVHGNQQPSVQATSTQEVAAAIGSGVDNSASSRRAVVQAAQPIANVPQHLPADAGQGAFPPQITAYIPVQQPYMVPVYPGQQMPQMQQMQVPLAMAPARAVNYVGAPGMPGGMPAGVPGSPMPAYMPGSGVGVAPARYDHPSMPGYSWPSYAAYPNYAAVTYPKQYSPTAWPYIGPFYPYPQVPLGWRKVTMEWDDGWWFLDFKDRRTMYNH
jgi:hypothetical protein